MVINRDGNVGIGTNDPSAKLDVNGNVKATSFIGDGSQLTGISTGKWSDVSGGISYGNNVSIMGDLKMAGTDSYIWTNGSGSGYTGLWDAANGRVAWKYVEGGDLQLVPSAGNVGISATAPSQKLEVNGNVKASGYFVGGITSSGSGDTNQPFRFSTDYSGWGMIFSEGWTSHNGWGIFWAGNSGAQYGTNGDGGPGNIWGNSGNPNEMAFVGGGETKWSIHLNDGNVWQKGKIVSMGIDVSNGSVYNSESESKGVWWMVLVIKLMVFIKKPEHGVIHTLIWWLVFIQG